MLRAWRRRWRRLRQRWNPPQEWFSPREVQRAPLAGWVRQAAISLALFSLLIALYQLPADNSHHLRRAISYVAEADYDPVAWYQSGQAREVMARYFSLEAWRNILGGKKTQPAEELPLLWPTRGQVTSGFGWRKDPATGKEEFHEGLDIAAPAGTPVLAAGAGTVKAVRSSPAYGKVVEIEHGGGMTTVYAHLAEVVVKEKQKVTAGEQVASVGQTGNARAPHLHFEVRLDGKPVDPLTYLPGTSP
ncbi:MAG: M23 family metallopeptidase [Bacillota bacterium]